MAGFYPEGVRMPAMVRAALGRDMRTTLVAVVAASVVAGPSAAAAAYVANADKVDGKHAVGSGASVAKRKGELVATNPITGLLPNNIIAKALDSGTLDGLDSTAFLRLNDRAADADKIDGRDSSELLPQQASAEFGDPNHEPITPLSRNEPKEIAHISIAVPGPGRIQVDGQTVLFGDYPSTWEAGAELSISTTRTAHNPSAAGVAIWSDPGVGTNESPSSSVHYETVPTTRTFDVTEAGTYTYYVVADGGAEFADPENTLYHYTSQVKAMYFPAP